MLHAEFTLDPDTANTKAGVVRLIRVPNKLLGKLLDRGTDSAYAIHLTALKLAHGPGWSINEHCVAKAVAEGGIEMGERKVREGLALAKRTGVLDRRIGGRQPNGKSAFARDTLATGGARYVELPEALVRSENSKLVAFVAATLLAPFPQDARDIAKRIGLSRKSTNSIARLVQDAVAGDYIAGERVGSHWIVARPGVDLAGFQNVDVQNVGIQNVAIHNIQQDEHRDLEDDHRKTAHQESYAAPASPADAAPLLVDADLRTAALTDPRLLGWADIEYGPANSDHLISVEPEAVDEIADLITDASLAQIVGVATEGRHHADMVSPAGLYAIRHLSAYLRQQDQDLIPHDALVRILATIADRIGGRDGAWLNSLAVIGKRLLGDRAPLAAAYLDELRVADGAGILAPRVFGKGRGSLTQLMNEFGAANTIDTIKQVLTRAMIDGGSPGSVTTWAYFRQPYLSSRWLKRWPPQAS